MERLTAGISGYATYTQRVGPLALFDWEQTDGLTVRFDGTDSRVVTAQGRRPVASHAWTYGEPATTAVTEHTFQQPGDYDVTLTVTDDDGNEDTMTQTVTVTGHQLTVKALPVEPGARYALGDTLVVETTLVNTGSQSVLNVVFPPHTYAIGGEPDLPPGAASPDAPRMERLRTREPETRAVLGVGERIAVRDSFRVTRVGRYTLDGQIVDAAETRAWAEMAGRVEASSASDEEVLIRRPCEGGACATFQVGPEQLAAEISGELAFRSVGDGGVVMAGLSYDESLVDASFYAFGADGQSDGCVSGCVSLNITATSGGDPVEGATVRVFVPQVAASETVTARPHGGWLVAPFTQTGSAPTYDDGTQLEVTTNAEGKAEVFYFTPGVSEDTPVTIRAEVEREGQTSDLELSFTVQPNRPSPAAWTANEATTAYLRTLASIIQTAGAGNSIGDYCENKVKWLRQQAPLIGDGAIDDATSLRRNTTLYLSNLGGNALCGVLIKRLAARFSSQDTPTSQSMQEAYAALGNQNIADIFNSLDAPSGDIKKYAQAHLYLYILYELDLGGRLLGLSLPSPEPRPVYASFQGDFSDVVVARFIEVMGAAPAGASYQIDLALEELSALNAAASLNSYDALLGTTLSFTPSGGAAQTFRDQHRIQYQPGTFLQPNPDPLTWLQEAVVTVGGAIPAAVGTTVIRGIDQVSESVLGAIVQIGEGLESEVNQIADVDESGRLAGGQASVTFAAPTLFAYPEGTEIRVVARGEGGVPAPPLPIPVFEPRESVRLEWLPGASIASSYNLEIARDTAFADVVYTRDGFKELAVQVTAEDLDLDRLYFWRVRATNALGDGDWAPWQPLLVNTMPTAGEPGAEAPPALVLSAPYPNPARSASVSVSVGLPLAESVRVSVYDALGREVAVVWDGPMGAGRQSVTLDTSRLPAGVYVVRLVAGAESAVQRLTVVR